MLVCKLSYLEAKYPCAHPSNAISVLPPALVCLFKSVLISTQFSFSHFFPDFLAGPGWGYYQGRGGWAIENKKSKLITQAFKRHFD